MSKLIIQNGFVFDPQHEIKGERKDIFIKEGTIVEAFSDKDAKVIDASGMTVMPGGVDLHAHIAGPKINTGRSFRPEDHRKVVFNRTEVARAGVGYSCPSTYFTGYRYAQLGYTTVIEPSVPPLYAIHSHEELTDTPIIDSGIFPNMGNHHIVLKYIRDGEFEKLKTFVALLLKSTKGYGVKLVNPGGVENWKYGGNVRGLTDEVEGFAVTPLEIIKSLCKSNEELGLPQTIQLHCNLLGVPGNHVITQETMKQVRNISSAEGRDVNCHIVHAQFNSYAGESFSKFSSGAASVADTVNKNEHITLDIGQVIFSDTTTLTGDGPWQYRLYKLSGNKWNNHDVENEGGGGVVPYEFRKQNPVNAIQWTMGIELALLINDPWRVYLTTDHPNAGPFSHYPKIISWLMSKKARAKTLDEIHSWAERESSLPLDREYTLYEIAIITRAGTAKALGMDSKGHLGTGARADVAIYDINPEALDHSNYEAIEKAFAKTAYTIKDGKIVVKDGKIVASPAGNTYWSNVDVAPDLEEEVREYMKEHFKKYYTIDYENYAVPEEYLPNSKEIKISMGGEKT